MIVLVTIFAGLMGTMVSVCSSVPMFINEPYTVALADNQPLNQSFLTVMASDPDLKGLLNFESIGINQAQNFFDVDHLTGEVFVTRSLKEDSVARKRYILRVVTYDTTVPDVRDTADVTISVTRNPGIPEWSAEHYEKTVNEEHDMSLPVLTVLATDSDEDTVTYRIIEDTTGSDSSDSLDYFFVNRDTGKIFLRKSLTEAPLDQYSFTVRATDSGNPQRSAEKVTVKIFITRVVMPVFHNTPYATQVHENTVIGTQIFTVTATDADGQGVMKYQVIGIGVAPVYFSTGTNGEIYTRVSLKDDTSSAYTVRVIAYDSLTPTQQATADVAVSVLRDDN